MASKKSYYMFERRDVSYPFKCALNSAGYVQTDCPYHADFLFYDLEHEAYQPVIEHFAESKKPIFVYPHSAASWYFWDGFHKEYPVSCNFVFTESIKNAMRAYGYKSRIEPIGFSFSRIGNNIRTKKNTLLYAPMHTMGIEGQDYLRAPASFSLNRKVLKRVFRLAPLFDSVTVRYGKSFKASAMYDPHIPNVSFEKAILKTRDAIRAIQEHSVVIAAGTFAYLSIALGKPTIFYNQRNEAPREDGMTVKSYLRYQSLLDYPIQIEDLSDSNIKNMAKGYDFYERKIRIWKKQNIGDRFEAKRFISVIKEFVR